MNNLDTNVLGSDYGTLLVQFVELGLKFQLPFPWVPGNLLHPC